MELCQEDLEFVERHFPKPHNSAERYRKFLLSIIQPHATLCTAAMADVENIIAHLVSRYKHRFFCRIDKTNQLKSPESIIDKIRRDKAADIPDPADLDGRLNMSWITLK